MNTFTEIENALGTLSIRELQHVQIRVEGWLKQKRYIQQNGPGSFPPKPPDVPAEEIDRIQAEIDRVFSRIE